MGLSDGYVVALFPSDVQNISTHLNIQANTFLRAYTYSKKVDIVGLERKYLHYLRESEGRCVFLNEMNLCEIHLAKPAQCRGWPQIIPNKTEKEVSEYPCITRSTEECSLVNDQLIDEIILKENPYGCYWTSHYKGAAC